MALSAQTKAIDLTSDARSRQVKAELRTSIAVARARTDKLFSLVQPDAFYERPVPERHRLVFYLGHLEAFDWNLLAITTLGLPSFDPARDHLFAFGIDPPPGQLPADKPSDWPTLQEIHGYNRRVRQVLDGLLTNVPEELLHVALEHRLMHAETFAYLLHNLALAYKHPETASAHEGGTAPSPRMCDIAAGTATLGRPPGSGFGWDNEFGEQALEVPAFAISKYKVTNAQYMRFVLAGGEAPPFWIHRNDQWLLRTMFEDIPLPSHWPVYATLDQAQAYAAWTGKALPTEAQFHRAAYGSPTVGESSFPWGEAPPDSQRGNFDFHRWDPVAVTASPGGDSAFGVSQLVGNGWEWTSSVFAPFPGFHPFHFYPGYSAPFFGHDHYVLKGGSPRTAARLLRRSFRNWFRRNYRYMYATFRCVEN